MSKPKKATGRSDKRRNPQVSTVHKASLPPYATNISLHCFILMAFSFLLYANTLFHDYTQDDAIVIYENMFTSKGVSGIPGILKYDTFYGFFKEEGKANLVAGGRYRPLTLIMFALENTLFGQSPFVGHLFNILYYGLTAIFFYLLLLKLFSHEHKNKYAWFIALTSALLFVAHPIHTEAVANIKGRDEIITLLGSLAALYFSLRAFQEKRPILNAVSALFFFLALLAKENAITFLAVVPLTYFIFTNARLPEIIKQTLPFAGMALLFLLIRGAVIGWSFGDAPVELMNNPFVKVEGNLYVPFSFAEKSATIMYTLGKYVQLLIFPHPLTHDYYPRHIGIMTWANPWAWVSLFLYLGMLVYAIKGIFRKDIISYGILFFLITLSIVSNVVFPIGTNMSERFVFMPSIGFCFVFSILAYKLSVIILGEKPVSMLRTFSPVIGVMSIILLLFSIKTIARNMVWKDNFTLFTTDVHVSANSAKLRNSVGGELIAKSIEEKDEAKRNQMLKEAAENLKKAVEIHPTYKNAHLLLGNCYNYLRQYDVSVQYFEHALKLDPSYQEADNNLFITRRDAGKYYGQEKGDLNKALKYLNEAYLMRPNDFETLRLLGVAYGVKGDNSRAIEFFSLAAKQKPNDADILWNLGSAYFNIGDAAKGNEYHQKARAIDPNAGKQ